jgi:hypothetical protein
MLQERVIFMAKDIGEQLPSVSLKRRGEKIVAQRNGVVGRKVTLSGGKPV